MSRKRIGSFALTAGILLSLAPGAARTEVCTPPDRLTDLPPMQAPCFAGVVSPLPGQPPFLPPTIYGPWLATCSGGSGYFPRLEQALTDAVESRITELTAGADRAWDKTLDAPVSTPFPPFCDLIQNASPTGCGALPTLSDQSTSSTDRQLRVDEPATGLALRSYRLGAWIESMREFVHEVVNEVKVGNTLSISPACGTIRDYISNTLARLGPTAFALQPNIEAIEDGQDPCPGQGLGTLSEVDQFRAKLAAAPFSTAEHYNPEIVRNRMSGCLMIAARKQIETAFIQLAACEVRARATAVDREFFVAGVCPAPLSIDPSLSIFDQLIRQQVLKSDCEKQGYTACTGAGFECLTGTDFDLTDVTCWTCFSQQIQSCFKKDLPSYLNSTLRPAPAVSLITGNLPSAFRALAVIPTTAPPASYVLKYPFTSEGCTSPTPTAGCPNTTSDLMNSGAKFALDNFQSVFDALNVTLSPLNSTLDLDSSKRNQQTGSGDEIPLDDFGPPTIFPGPAAAGANSTSKILPSSTTPSVKSSGKK